jgi:hypothetical protein
MKIKEELCKDLLPILKKTRKKTIITCRKSKNCAECPLNVWVKDEVVNCCIEGTLFALIQEIEALKEKENEA